MIDAPPPSRVRRRRSWLRIIGLPVAVLVVAWTLHARSSGAEAATLEQIERDARAYVRSIVDAGRTTGTSAVPAAGRPVVAGEVGEAAPGVRAAATAAIRARLGELRAAGWMVRARAGDDGPGPAGAATHTVTVLSGEQPAVHLRLAVDGSRTVLCGHWLAAP